MYGANNNDGKSGVAIEQVGMDVSVKFGDSILNSCRIILLFPGHTRFHALLCSI